MVLVDTSIWIRLYRNRDAEIGQKLWMLAARNDAAICGQIWVEFLGGFRDASRRARHEELLAAFPFLETTRATYGLAATLLAAHPRIGAGDAIIAATAISTSVALWSSDRDFEVLEPEGLRLLS